MKQHFFCWPAFAIALALCVSSCEKEESQSQDNQKNPEKTEQVVPNESGEIKVDDLENYICSFKGEELTIKVSDYDHSKVMTSIYRAGKKLSSTGLQKAAVELPFKLILIIPEGIIDLEFKTDLLTSEEKSDFLANGCPLLSQVEIPSSVKNIGENAFQGCKNLEEIILPQTIESIGSNAFKGCQSLQEANIPQGVKSIGQAAFQECKALKNIDIPTSVEEIGSNAFQGCQSLEQLEIPKGVKTIGESAFQNCTSLEKVEIPSTVETIGDNAFKDCQAIEEVIAKGNAEVVQNAFDEQVNIEYGISLEKLKEYLANSKADTVELVMKDYNHQQVMDAIIESGKTVDLTIPEGVTTIERENYTFSEELSKIVSVNLPSTLEVIGKNAFYRCELNKITLPENLKRIEIIAFSFCKFNKINIPKSVEYIGQRAFGSCSALDKVVFEDGADPLVHPLAFNECPCNISKTYTFKTSSEFERFMKNYDSKIGITAKFEGIHYNHDTVMTNIMNSKCLVSLDLTEVEGVVKFRDDSPRGPFTNLTEVAFNSQSKITEIGDYAFAGSLIQYIVLPYPCTRIGKHAFDACKELAGAVWFFKYPQDFDTYVDDYAFKDCEQLTLVHITAKGYSFGHKVFEGSSLAEVDTGDFFNPSLMDDTFAGCPYGNQQ